MGRAMAQGMIDADAIAAKDLTVVDHNQSSALWWAEHLPAATFVTDVDQATGEYSIVILAVKPIHLASLIGEVRGQKSTAWPDSFVISVAAGVDLATLEHLLGSDRIARVMPNTPSLVREGASGFCLGKGATEQDLSDLNRILSAIGIAQQVPEAQLEAITGLSGSGPAYVFMFIESLADGGVAAGLPRDKAMRLAVQTVLGAARMVQQTGEHPGVLKDAVASPGGTTIAAIHALEHNAFRGAVIDAVLASAKRAREISDQLRIV
jgi:pyrroline-5-carboxylate reductase